MASAALTSWATSMGGGGSESAARCGASLFSFAQLESESLKASLRGIQRRMASQLYPVVARRIVVMILKGESAIIKHSSNFGY
jgi:hypothetical protein